MKRIALCFALLGSIALAQAHPNEPIAPEARAAQLQKVLQLNDDQTAKIKKVLESSAQQRNALFEKYKPQFDAFHTEMKSAREKTHAQIAAVLTPKQAQAMESLEALRDQHKHEMRGPHGKQDGEYPNDREPPPTK